VYLTVSCPHCGHLLRVSMMWQGKPVSGLGYQAFLEAVESKDLCEEDTLEVSLDSPQPPQADHSTISDTPSI